MSLNEMAGMAYMLDLDALKKGKAGFKSPQELKAAGIKIMSDDGPHARPRERIWEHKVDD